MNATALAALRDIEAISHKSFGYRAYVLISVTVKEQNRRLACLLIKQGFMWKQATAATV
jgi:hypothetical protein